METQEQQKPPPQAATSQDSSAAFSLAKPRSILKQGLPTDGYWVIAGLPKNGKTSFAASIPGALILELEKGGADRVAGWIQDIPDMETFRKALKIAFEEPTVKVIVIDTLDIILKNIATESANKFGLDSISEKKEGVNGFAVWEEVFSRVHRMTETFKACGKLVILLCHFREPKMDSDGKLVISQSIDAPSSKISSHICAHADVIGVASKKRIGEKSQYSLRFHGDGVVGAYGSRVPELEDKTVVLPRTGQWGAVTALFETPEAKTKAAAPETKTVKNETKAAPAKTAVGGKR